MLLYNYLINKARDEGTCQKRKVVCALYDVRNRLIGVGVNKCSPIGGTCHRLGIVNTKENYIETGDCHSTHAEFDAVANMWEEGKPVKAVAYGHSFYCDTCENMLRELGVAEFEMHSEFPVRAGAV